VERHPLRRRLQAQSPAHAQRADGRAEEDGLACISLNSAVCANNPPQLVLTDHGDPAAKCRTKTLTGPAEKKLRAAKHVPARITKAAKLEEVTDHPLLTLLDNANPVHNSFDLWELTTL